MLKKIIRRLALPPIRLALYAAGRAYVPGYQLSDGLRIVSRLPANSAGFTLGYFYSANDTPEKLAHISHQIIDAIAPLAPKGYISIKAPALDYAPDILAGIATSAKNQGILIHFDSHEHFTAEPTMACIRNAVAHGCSVGLTIPGRWLRSLDDADECSALGIRVRVVKGEWADPTAPYIDLCQGFLNVIDRLAGKARQVAVATHDPWLARESIARLQAAGTDCELELLNGLPKREMLLLASELGVPVRFYIPFGVAWRPYALSKAAANPRIVWWVVKDAAKGLISHLRKARAR